MALNWDSTFELALELRKAHPSVDLGAVSLGQVYEWTLALSEFGDDPSLCNDEILESIYQEWFEVSADD